VLDTGLVYIKAYIVAIVVGTLAFFSLGSLLPLWVFVNSLQIITHSILLHTGMPGNVHYVFKDYLDLVRLNWPALNLALDDRSSYRQETQSSKYFNIFLETSDYVYLFAPNLVLVGTAGLAVLLVWISLALKDNMRVKHRLPGLSFFRKKHEPQANNFALRFFYEFFFEICLCALINIAAMNFSGFMEGLQWAICLMICVGIFAYLAWILSLFCKNGPFLDGFYTKGTFLESFWMARPFDTAFNAQHKLEKMIKRRER